MTVVARVASVLTSVVSSGAFPGLAGRSLPDARTDHVTEGDIDYRLGRELPGGGLSQRRKLRRNCGASQCGSSNGGQRSVEGGDGRALETDNNGAAGRGGRGAKC